LRRRAAVCLALLASPAVARAQAVSLGVQGALGDYREVSSNRRFRGTGVASSLWLDVGRLSGEGTVSRVRYDPAVSSVVLDRFTATQIDARVGLRVAPGLAAEVGWLHRTIAPELATQEMAAARIGLKYFKSLGPGATAGLRAAYLAGARFTGEGSAGLAFELGMFVGLGSRNGRYRLTADYGFQRIDRKVNAVAVPIEQSLVRVGVAVGFW
jgi:hypothetical protein